MDGYLTVLPLLFDKSRRDLLSWSSEFLMHYFSRSEPSAWLRRIARVNRAAPDGAAERAIKDKAVVKRPRIATTDLRASVETPDFQAATMTAIYVYHSSTIT